MRNKTILGDILRNIQSTLGKKATLGLLLDLQISRAHQTPKDESESVCRPIFAQFVNGVMPTMLEGESPSFRLQNSQTSLSRKCLQNDSQREGMKH